MNRLLFYLFLSLISFMRISNSNEILIESEELVITNNPLTTNFIGNVYAFDDEIEMWSDKILILYTEVDNKIDQIKSFGNTKLIRENQEITAKNIIYHVIDKKIYAKGNITLIEDKNVIKGDELNVDLVKSISIMKSDSKSRVKVIINDN